MSGWRKSSYSNSGGCVEAGAGKNRVLVRDTKNEGAGPVLSFPADAWRTFAASLKGT